MAWFDERISKRKEYEEELQKEAYEFLEREISDAKYKDENDEENNSRFYRKLPREKQSLLGLFAFGLKGISVKSYVRLIAAIVAAAVAAALVPELITKVISFADVGEQGSYAMGIGIALIGAAFFQAVFGAVREYIAQGILTDAQAQIEGAIMQRVLELPISFFGKYSSGDLAVRVISAGVLFSTVSSSAISTIMGFTVAPGYFVQMLTSDYRLVEPALAIMALLVVILIIQSRVMAKLYREAVKLNVKNSGVSYSFITGIQKLKLCGAENFAFVKWLNGYAKEAGITYMPSMFVRVLPTIASIVSSLGALWTAHRAYTVGADVSTYYGFQYAFGVMLGIIDAAFSTVDVLTMAYPQLEMVKPVLETVPETESRLPKVEKLRGNVIVSNVSFRYSDDSPYIFNGLNMRIRKGEYVAIVGRTGCGKSTLIRLLLGFEVPQRGLIMYDDHDITKVNIDSVRRHLGVVLQDGKLFADNILSNINVGNAKSESSLSEGFMRGSIFQNIVMNTDDKGEQVAWEAAEVAGIADDIREMPMGMHTMISEGSGGVSGGQKQRILIARAVANKPSVLIFDEATSALDNITQKKVSDALGEMNCTRIVVAHRLSTIRYCDRIMVIDNGQIVQEGTYDELISRDGLFKELAANQLLDKEC